MQEILRESCTVITSLHDFVDLGLRLTDNLLRRQYQANIVIEMVRVAWVYRLADVTQCWPRVSKLVDMAKITS